MSRMWKSQTLRAAIAAPLIVLTCASLARAQAFVPPKGEGTVSFLYQDLFVKYHYFGPTRTDNGSIASKMMVVDVTYGVTDKLAVSAGIPWVAAKYKEIGRA